jgi:hypothetical protein
MPVKGDLLAGGIFTLIGGVFVAGSLSHDRGTLLRMGPGLFPMIAGAIVAALGLAIMLVSRERAEPGPVPWRAVILIVLAVVFFGTFVRTLGFVLTSFVTALLTTLASPRIRLLHAVAVAAGLTVAATLIFVLGLQLRIPLWGF